MEADKKIIIYTDGGSRGNPGHAALGVAIYRADGASIKSYGETLGTKTNNEAEYLAVVSGLKKVKALFGKNRVKKMHIEVRLDSELVKKQLSGEYHIEQEHLFPFFMSIWSLRIDFAGVVFVHIPREKNKEADRMVNEALDGKGQEALWP